MTVTGTGSLSYYPIAVYYTGLDNSNNIAPITETCSGSTITVTCLRNSVVTVIFNGAMSTVTSDGATVHKASGSILVADIEDVATASIENTGSSGGSGSGSAA